jgi:uncharacterized protein
MTSQERRMLQDFFIQLTQVKGVTKDQDADALINSVTARQPDAVYLLVQRAFVQDQALRNAQAEIARLQSEVPVSKSVAGGSFLGSASAWGQPASDLSRTQPATPVFGAAPVNVGGKPSFFSSGLGSLLGSAATTAAGIAGGAFLFQGIENLMGHHGVGSGFFGQDQSQAPVGSTTINNYYSSDDTAIDDDTNNDDGSGGNDDSTSA